jgi:hypothetical protein
MCRQHTKTFLCLCPHRNDPSRCPHAAYLRVRAEAVVDEPLADGGWYTRSSPQAGQRHTAWEAYAVGWEHCTAYRVKHFDRRTGLVAEGFEAECKETARGAGAAGGTAGAGDQKKEMKTVYVFGLCQGCMGGHQEGPVDGEGEKKKEADGKKGEVSF